MEADKLALQSKFLLLSPSATGAPALTGATNLVKHYGLHTSSVLSGAKTVHNSFRPYVSHLPGGFKSKDPETRLASLFRAEEWPIPPDDDSLVLQPLGKEALAAFMLQDGKIQENKRKRHKSKDGTKKHRHRQKHAKVENGDAASASPAQGPGAGGVAVSAESGGVAGQTTDDAKEKHRHRHRHKKHRSSGESDGSQPKKKKRKREEEGGAVPAVGATHNGANGNVNLVPSHA